MIHGIDNLGIPLTIKESSPYFKIFLAWKEQQTLISNEIEYKTIFVASQELDRVYIMTESMFQKFRTANPTFQDSVFQRTELESSSSLILCQLRAFRKTPFILLEKQSLNFGTWMGGSIMDARSDEPFSNPIDNNKIVHFITEYFRWEDFINKIYD